MQAKVDLRPSPLKDLMTPYKKVFAEHQQVRAYSLSDEAREKMFTYETNEGDMGSKVLKNALKMVVNMHVLYHGFSKVQAYSDLPQHSLSSIPLSTWHVTNTQSTLDTTLGVLCH